MSEYNYFPVSLPSKCLTYKGVDPTLIKIRTLKGEDEKIIAEISSDNFDKKYNLVLTRVLQGIDPLKLTLGDRFFLVMWETINSYSKDFPIDYVCDFCRKKFEYIVDLSLLGKVELPGNYKEPCEIKLPKSGTTVKLRLLTVKDLIEIGEVDRFEQNTWLYKPAISIDNGKSLADRLDYLSKLDTQDIEYIRGFQDAFDHGMDMNTQYTCPKCGGVGDMPVPFLFDFLLPVGKALKRRVGNAIRASVLSQNVSK